MHHVNVFVCVAYYECCTVVQSERGLGDRPWGIVFFSGTANSAGNAGICQLLVLQFECSHVRTDECFPKCTAPLQTLQTFSTL